MSTDTGMAGTDSRSDARRRASRRSRAFSGILAMMLSRHEKERVGSVRIRCRGTSRTTLVAGVGSLGIVMVLLGAAVGFFAATGGFPVGSLAVATGVTVVGVGLLAFVTFTARGAVWLEVIDGHLVLTAPAFLVRPLRIAFDDVSVISYGTPSGDTRGLGRRAAFTVAKPRPNLDVRFAAARTMPEARSWVGWIWRALLNRVPEPNYFEVPRAGHQYWGVLLCVDAPERVAGLLGEATNAPVVPMHHGPGLSRRQVGVFWTAVVAIGALLLALRLLPTG